MDEIRILTKIRRELKESYQQIGDAMIAGTVDNMEKYKYMMGQAHAYYKISQDISNLLNDKEQKDEKGTVCQIRRHRRLNMLWLINTKKKIKK